MFPYGVMVTGQIYFKNIKLTLWLQRKVRLSKIDYIFDYKSGAPKLKLASISEYYFNSFRLLAKQL